MTELARHLFYVQGGGQFLAGDAPLPVDDGAAASVTAPEWVNIMPVPDDAGHIYSRDYRVLRIDDLKKLAARSNAALKRQRGGGPVDADHKLYGGFFTSGGGPVLGWAEQFEARDDGLYARVDWLPEGRELIESKRYRYTSSVVTGGLEWEFDEDGWPSRLWIDADVVEGFGITNIPALETTSMFTHQGDDAMKIETMRVLCAQLGISEDASPDQVKAAFMRAKARFTSAAEPSEAAPADAPTSDKGDGGEENDEESDEADDDLEAPAEAAPTEVEQLRKRVAELEREQAETFVASLVHDGKLTPAQRKAAAALAAKPGGLTDLKALYAAAPAVINPERPPALLATDSVDRPPHGTSEEAWRFSADTSRPIHEVVRDIELARAKKKETR